MDEINLHNREPVEIERRSGLTTEDIYREYLTGCGMPVILTDATKPWKAHSTWSFDFFRHKYGSETVAPGLGIYGNSSKIMKFSDFIDYVEDPSRKARGFWLDSHTRLPRNERPEDTIAPLYLYDQNAFLDHPELLEDVKPDPPCIDDWLALLPEAFQRLLQKTRYYHRGLLIGAEGSVSRLHYDFLHTHAYLAQIAGKKLCILFSPKDSEFLSGGDIHPENPDIKKFPLFEKATAFVCVLNPGELLLIPSHWWHYVRNLEKSITVNYNFFNRTNFGEYFVDLFKVLPEILEGFDRVPNWHAELGVKWESEGFRWPEEGKL